MSATQIHAYPRLGVWWVQYTLGVKCYRQMFSTARAAFDFAADLRSGAVA